MPTSTTKVRTVALTVLVSAALMLGACSQGPSEMTEEDLVERVAEAMREAPQFQFTYAEDTGTGVVETEGSIAYDDEGAVESLHFRSTDEDGVLTEEYVLTEGTMYASTDGEAFSVVDDEEIGDVLLVWDWAEAMESYGQPQSLEVRGDSEVIDGAETVEYEVTFEDHIEIWWIDAEDQMRQMAVEDYDLPHATLTDYGVEVQISEPDEVE